VYIPNLGYLFRLYFFVLNDTIKIIAYVTEICLFMKGDKMAAFIIWLIMSLFFVGMGIVCFISKKEKAFGFWANAETLPVKDVKAYNRALGKLWCAYGVALAFLGIPLLQGQNSAGAVVSILGTMFLSIILMAVYVTVIERKYRK